MQYGEHHFQPDLQNEMRCDLCGEHVAFSLHVRTKAPHQNMPLQHRLRRYQQQSEARAFLYSV